MGEEVLYPAFHEHMFAEAATILAKNSRSVIIPFAWSIEIYIYDLVYYYIIIVLLSASYNVTIPVKSIKLQSLFTQPSEPM